MTASRWLALALIAAGVLGLAFGTFRYTKQTHSLDLGVVGLSVKEEERVNIPVWVGVGVIGVGGVLLLFPRKRS